MLSTRSELRIGIDASAMLVARKNGYENYVDALLRHLVALPAAELEGLQLIFYFHAGSPLADARQLDALLPQFAGFRCRVYRPGRMFGLYLPLMAQLDRLDWLHLPVHLWRGRFPCRVMTTFHDACGKRAFEEGLVDQEHEGLRSSIARQVRISDYFVADSESSRNDLHEFYGVPLERIRTVHLGVEGTFRPDRQSAQYTREFYGLPSYILSVNAIQGNKNYVRLLRAFALLRQHYKIPHVLAIVGRDGWGSEAARAEIDRLQLGDAVRLLGYVPTQHLNGLYTGADLVVNASLCEGFGLPVLEALACNAVVATADTTSLPEVGGDAVAFFDPRDENQIAKVMHSALMDEQLRQQLRLAGSQRVREFSWDASAMRMAMVYRSLTRA